MKTDINGTSQCKPGKENYEIYPTHKGRQLVQYDYRHTDGELYSTIAPSLDEARERKDRWLEDKIRQEEK